MSWPAGTNINVDQSVADLVRGVCNQRSDYTIKRFFSEAALEKIKRMKLKPKPSHTVRRGAPPKRKAAGK